MTASIQQGIASAYGAWKYRAKLKSCAPASVSSRRRPIPLNGARTKRKSFANSRPRNHLELLNFFAPQTGTGTVAAILPPCVRQGAAWRHERLHHAGCATSAICAAVSPATHFVRIRPKEANASPSPTWRRRNSGPAFWSWAGPVRSFAPSMARDRTSPTHLTAQIIGVRRFTPKPSSQSV